MSERSPKRIEEAVIKDILADRMTPLLKKILENNQIVKHNYKKEIEHLSECALPGCHENFQLILFPNQLIYPKYCEKHRSSFQRSLWKNSENDV